ncbi:hypothetical protein EAF00_009051 [Botryotinia globosa]|nr:hypothetical protein EAF00_009051 [Botryotinia globosa]
MSAHRRNLNDNLWTYSTNAVEGQTDNFFKDSDGTPHATNEKLTAANNGKITLRERINRFKWATGGIALLLANTPHKFNGLTLLGDIVFILDLCLFVFLCSGISARFILYPKALSASLQDATESLFFPTFWISLLSIIANTQLYAVPHCGPWLIAALRVIFWIYTAPTFSGAVGQYCYLFAAKQQTLQSMTPAWILPIFSVMLCGTLASVTTGSQTPEYALPMLVAGITFQGLGIFVAVFMYGPYVGRLMTNGLPEPNMRPGMFIAVGPPSFTGLALLGMSENFSKIYPAYTTISSITNQDIIADVFRIIAVSAAVFLWATAFWFFCISMVSVLAGAKEMSFHLVRYAFVFPNVGFTIVIIKIGKAFKSEGVLWVGSGLTIILVIVWLLVFAAHIRAVVLKQVLWPGKDEDKGERSE